VALDLFFDVQQTRDELMPVKVKLRWPDLYLRFIVVEAGQS
jgi:hypothetical protein